MARMLAPRLVVTLDNDEEYTIQTDNRDMVRFDMLRARKGWPTMQEAPFVFMTVLAWSCLAREGKLGSTDVDKELDRIIGVEPIDEAGNTVDIDTPEGFAAITADPTNRGS